MRNQLEAWHNFHIVKNHDGDLIWWVGRSRTLRKERMQLKNGQLLEQLLVEYARDKNVTWRKMMAAIRMQK